MALNTVDNKYVIVRESALAGTAATNVTSSAGKWYGILIDNTAGSAVAAYVRLYDDLSPVIGTTAPDWVFYVAAGTSLDIVSQTGVTITNGLTIAAITVGGTAGSTGISPALANIRIAATAAAAE